MAARVIPPLSSVATVDANSLDLALFTITEAMLTASTLPETPPAAYNGATTYNTDDQVSVAGANNSFDVYRSKIDSNTGNDPTVSPTEWELLGTTYGVYAAGTYALDDRAIDATNHLEYLSLVGSNTAALSDDTKWQLQGPTNRWRAFDTLRNTKATGPSGLSFTITPGQRVDAVGVAGVVADSFTISVVVSGVEVWTYTESLSTRHTLKWSDYFFGAFSFRSVSAVFNIPKYSGAEITISFARSAGDVEVGAIWINNAVYLGELEVDPDLDQRNFSTIDNQADGTTVLIRRRTIPVQNWTLYVDKPYLAAITPLIDDLNAVPALWVGLDDTDDEYFAPTTLVAVYTRFTITPGHPLARIALDLKET